MAAAVIMSYFVLLMISNYLCATASAYDTMPMQDFCVADFNTAFGRSGIRPFPCKDPKTVTVNDFFTSGLDSGGNTSNTHHASLRSASVLNIPGLNTMGFILSRADLDVGGTFPLHYHQRASELVVVVEGCLEAGFVTSEANNYTHFTKNLSAGDVFVIPVGLVHYWANCGNGKTSAYAILNSQNPGVSSVTRTVFGPQPPMSADYLASTYQLSATIVKELQAKKWSDENI